MESSPKNSRFKFIMPSRRFFRTAENFKGVRSLIGRMNHCFSGSVPESDAGLAKRLGTAYGGWYVPRDLELNADSFVISAGVGEDMSFDLILQALYGCLIVLVDPTPRAITHFAEIQQFYLNGRKTFSGAIQKDYLKEIRSLTPDMTKFVYEAKAFWSASDLTIPFYHPQNPAHVSHTLIPGMYGKESASVSTVSLKEIMETHGHGRPPDLLKMDIEGAELTVLDEMLSQKIFPRYLLIEFDLMGRPQDADNHSGRLVNTLSSSYNLIMKDKKNYSFVSKTK